MKTYEELKADYDFTWEESARITDELEPLLRRTGELRTKLYDIAENRSEILRRMNDLLKQQADSMQASLCNRKGENHD